MEIGVFIFICLGFGIAAAIAAGAKGRSGCGWFILGFLLGPFGLLFILLLPPATSKSLSSPAPPAPALLSFCPDCGQTIINNVLVGGAHRLFYPPLFPFPPP